MNFVQELKSIKQQSPIITARERIESHVNKSVSRNSEGEGRKDTLISGFSDEDINES